MSGAIDKLSSEEEAQLRQMQSDDRATEPARETPAPAAEPSVSRETPETPPAAETPTQQMVDKRALDEERERRRSLQRELAEMRSVTAAERARLEEEVRIITEATEAKLAQEAAAAKPPEEPPPSWETNPVEAIQWSLKQQERWRQEQDNWRREMSQQLQSITQGNQQNQQTQDLVAWGRAQEAAYVRDPAGADYNPAVAFLRQTRAEELQIMGYAPDQIEAVINQEALNAAQLARQNGVSFPKMLHDLAVRRGYRSNGPAAASPAAQAQAPAAPSNGAAPQPLPTPESAAERLIRGQEMATTIGAQGGAARGMPAPAVLFDMSDEAFDKYVKKFVADGGDIRDIMGA